MKSADVIRELESLGTEQNRKIHRRHDVGGVLYGVSYANLEKLRKRIKVDHGLALKLWASGVHDARILATMIADPERMDGKTLDAWAAEAGNYIAADALAALAARAPDARKKAERWTKSKDEFVGRTGWSVVAALATRDGSVPDAFFEPYLAIIERDVHVRKNRVREGMNNALIAIGCRSDALEARALEIARRVGVVDVDHGETGCKTPDAVAYIKKTRDRLRARRVGA